MNITYNITGSTFPVEPPELVTFTEEILNGKLHFLCSVSYGFSDMYKYISGHYH